MSTPETSYFSGGPAPATPDSLWQWLSSTGAERPDVDALAALHQPANHLSNLIKTKTASRDHFSWTFRQLIEAAESVAASFVSGGVKPGDVVALFVPNSAEWGVILWACFRMGVVFAPIDPTALGRAEELEYLVGALDPTVIVVNDETAARAYDQHCSREIMLQLVCDGGTLPGWLSLSHLTPPTSITLPPAKSDPNAVAYILFTSGTTSFPKGCPLTVQNITAEITGYHSFYGSQWDSTARFLVTSMCFRPICYLGCLNSWRGGGSVVVPSSYFSDDVALRAIVSQRITNMMLVPSQVRSLSNSPTLATHRPSTLRFVTCSGDTCPADVIEYGQKSLQTRRLVFHWGMSEGAPLFGWLGEEQIPVTGQGNIPGLGRALPGTTVRVCESGNDNHIVSRGVVGELEVDSTSLVNRYLSEEHTKMAFLEDESGRQWFRTGDLAYMDGSGVIFIVGRSKDMIKCKGVGIVPSIVEDCLEKAFRDEVHSHHGSYVACLLCADAKQVQVVGIPDSSYGANAIAVMKGARPESDNLPDIRQKAKQQVIQTLGPEYTLGGVAFFSDLRWSDWPKNSSHKIVKKDIVDAVLQRQTVLG